MKTPRRILMAATLMAAVIQTISCGGGGTISDPPVDTPPPVTGLSEPVASMEELPAAVVQIQAKGTFLDPAKGAVVGTGSGSGFFIDSSGIAVTNNHVVTGSASLEVFIPGEAKPRFAKLLGYSECSDLAVVDVDGEGLPYLEWLDGSITTGLKVFAAGYPLGDPEFTLTDGVIAKTDSSRASLLSGPQEVFEHTANLQPGNSGGPLVNEEGKVIGINYLAISGPLGPQFFAIARDEALSLIEDLKAGRNIGSIGINGQAAQIGSDATGIWVAAVQSGSPAGKAGVKAGDVILTLEALPMAADGTLKDYCDILRSHDLNAVLKVQILRSSTGEILEGEINGNPLQVVFSPEPVDPEPDPTPDPTPDPAPEPAGSCAGSCGEQSADGCWCDDGCETFGDCCADKAEQCG